MIARASVLACALAGTAFAAPAEAPPAPSDAYRGALEALAAALRAGRDDVRAEAEAARRACGAEGDTSFLEPCLQGPLPAADRESIARCAEIILARAARIPDAGIARRAGTLRLQEARSLPVPISPDTEGEAAAQTTEKSLFAHLLDWLEDGFERFGRWLRRVFGRSSASGGPAFSLSITAIWIAVALAVVLGTLTAFLLLRRRRAATHEDDQPAAASAPVEGPLAAAITRAPDEWIDRYAAHERNGRFRDAIRDLLLGSLVALYRRGALAYRRGSTNRDYVAALPAGSGEREALARIAAVFDRHWYGLIPAGREDALAAASSARIIVGARSTLEGKGGAS
ncbi:MAG: DUF4129 domain-containing protein [Planctomycetes bacterium]|nr:DUF4129 domain-containing protein [Planctomycetota bacterium]